MPVRGPGAILRGMAFAKAFLLCVSAAWASGAYDAAMKAGVKPDDANDCARAHEGFSKAVEISQAYGDGDMRYLAALVKLAAVQEQLGEAARAEATLTRGLKTVGAPKKADSKLIGTYWWRFSRALFRQHKGERAYEAVEVALIHLTKAGDKDKLADAYNDAGNILNMLARHEESQSHRQEAVRRYRALGRLGSVATVCLNQAMHFSKRGLMDQAWPAYDCVIREGAASGGLVKRKYANVLERYAEDLRRVGESARAEEMEATLAAIKALPPEKPGACSPGRVTFTTTY